ncbi:class I adenylate-forming enzyme family protein [Roseimaritima sediminicola]|uniref:class I adenylate-forming enzyme family protein n=1 Tax=Roseimaritima sediminicola TaxID=2662066 RepID=UPI0012984F42|nr:AMP-binding protein [Roseimaritima sediminicola]
MPRSLQPPSLCEALLRHAAERPDAAALWNGREWLTWGHLQRVVAVNAAALSGLPPATRIVTTFANDATAVVGALAVMAAGHVEVPVGDRGRSDEIEAIARRCETSVRLSSAEINLSVPRAAPVDRAGLETMLAQHDPNRDAVILWTSGTTATPRGVVLSARALAANAAGKLAAVPQRPDQRRLIVLPLWHSFARTCDFGTWLHSGSRLAVTLGWDGLKAWAPKIAPQFLSVVPRLVKRLLGTDLQRLPERLRSLGLADLRVLGCGGAALSPEDYASLARLGICVIHGYGLTEAGPVVCSATPEDACPGAVGRPIDGTRIRIDSDGHLYASGPGLMSRYLNDPQATAAVLQDGWLRTGDLAQQDQQGLVRILGRADDTIVRDNGLKLQPRTIEQQLERSPLVQHCVLWQDRGGQLVAVVELTGKGVEVDAEHCRGELQSILRGHPGWMQPQRWVLLRTPLPAEMFTDKGTPRRRLIGRRYAEPVSPFAPRK